MHGQVQGLAAVLADLAGQFLPAFHRGAVHRHDEVAGFQSGPFGGGVLDDAAHVGGDVREAGSGKHGKQGEKGEYKIEGRAGQDNGGPLPQGPVQEGAVHELRGHFVVGVFPQEFDVAAQGHHGNAVVGFAHLLGDQLRGEAQGENLHFDPQELGGEKMAQLVNKNEDAQDRHGGHHGGQVGGYGGKRAGHLERQPGAGKHGQHGIMRSP